MLASPMVATANTSRYCVGWHEITATQRIGIDTPSLRVYTHIMKTANELTTMSLSDIALLIRRDWRATSKNGVNFAAKPYLDAMADLNDIKDNYGADSGQSIVMYFLSNATTYRGEQAKLIKAELKNRLK